MNAVERSRTLPWWLRRWADAAPVSRPRNSRC